MEAPLGKPAFSCTRAGGIIRPVATGRFRSIASLGTMAFMERVVRARDEGSDLTRAAVDKT